MHKRELRRSSNTGRLALGCLVNSLLIERPEGESEVKAELWPAGTQPLLLFPADDALPLDAWQGQAQTPATLIVPDGTWAQASRMRQRVSGLSNIPCVRLPEGEPSRYRLRAVDRSSRVSTLEAIARALGILESAMVRETLERVLAMMVERTLWMRGQLDRTQVTGGIPEGVGRHFPPWSSTELRD